MNLPKDVTNNPVKYAKVVVILVVVIIVIVIAINAAGGINALISKIKGLFGLATDPDAEAARDKVKKEDTQASANSSPWSTAIFDNMPSNTSLVSSDTVSIAAQQIYDSAGFFTTSASDGYAAIKMMPSQCDVSHLVKIFQANYQRDLYNYMTRLYSSDMNVKIMTQILDYVKGLPVYITY